MPTTTAAVIISDALKEILVIGEGETPSATMYSDGLRMLNRMLDTMGLSSDFAYENVPLSFTMNGATSFTIGPSTSDLTAARPNKIDSANYVVSGITYPVEVLDYELYDTITMKALSGAYPEFLFYDGTYPNGTAYPYPQITGGVLNMRVTSSVKQFATTAANIDMPEGYEDAIMLALACRMAPGYGKRVSEDTKNAARKAMKAVNAINEIVPTMSLPDAVMGNAGSSYASFLSGS